MTPENKKIKEIQKELKIKYWASFQELLEWSRCRDFREVKLEIIKNLRDIWYWVAFIWKILNRQHSAIVYNLTQIDEPFTPSDLKYIKKMNTLIK